MGAHLLLQRISTKGSSSFINSAIHRDTNFHPQEAKALQTGEVVPGTTTAHHQAAKQNT